MGTVRSHVTEPMQATFDARRISRNERFLKELCGRVVKSFLIGVVLPVRHRGDIPQHVTDRVQEICARFVDVTEYWGAPRSKTISIKCLHRQDGANSKWRG